MAVGNTSLHVQYVQQFQQFDDLHCGQRFSDQDLLFTDVFAYRCAAVPRYTVHC